MRALLTILFALSTLICDAQKADGTIIEQTEVTLPAYEAVQGIDRYYPESIYDEAVSDRGWTIKKLWYYSDGLKVAAYVATPSPVKGKYPVIIFNRGSSVRNDIAFVHAPLFRKFIENGFVVIAPALRQSEGSEGKDEIGGADIHDILNIAKVYPQLSFVDSSNVFMLGESRGGIMTFLAMKNGMNLNAAATVGAITDLDAYLNDNSWINPLEVWPDYRTNPEIRESRSALLWPERITAPLLIMNGGVDPQVKPYHALKLALRLSERKKTYQLKIVEGGNHILSGAATNERDREIIEWFRKHTGIK